MKVNSTAAKAAFVIAGICFVCICTLLVASYVYRVKKTAVLPVISTEETLETAKDALKEFILEHEQLRSLQLYELDEIINSEKSSEEMIAAAQKEKMEIVRRLETESTISGILQARGYNDAAVAAGDDYVNIMVRALQAEARDIARILELVISQTDVSADNIKIIPVN